MARSKGHVNMLELWDKQLFELTRSQPVALAFSDSKPEGLPRATAPQPSACAFWKLASEGSIFYAEASDHFGCAVGAYTLGAELTEIQQQELQGMVGTMIDLSYLRQGEVPSLPRRSSPLRFAIYAPLALSPMLPDVVLVRANARQLMLLTEAARAAGYFDNVATMGRPACGIVPESAACGHVALSLACIGNRIYTGLEDEESYVAIPGSALEAICGRLDGILQANESLAAFHSARQSQFASQT
jgi:uncharacterized protein (DUF169 family)